MTTINNNNNNNQAIEVSLKCTERERERGYISRNTEKNATCLWKDNFSSVPKMKSNKSETKIINQPKFV